MAEWPVLAKIAVAALILIIICAAVFFFVNTTLSATNNGGQKLSGVMSDLDEKVFAPYDQTVVTGARVLSAIKEFKEQNVAVIVRTSTPALTAGGMGGQDVRNYGAMLFGVDDGDSGTPDAEEIESFTIYGDCSARMDVDRHVFGPRPTDHLRTNGVLFPEYRYDGLRVATNLSDRRHIVTTAYYTSCLIRDVNGSLVGIYFSGPSKTYPTEDLVPLE
jgi:hypothetical protein